MDEALAQLEQEISGFLCKSSDELRPLWAALKNVVSMYRQQQTPAAAPAPEPEPPAPADIGEAAPAQ